MRTEDGKPVVFVAKPELAEPTDTCVYARPDDIAESGQRWRDLVLEYNRAPGDNPRGLRPAWQLYQNRVYRALVQRYSTDKVYILSAGWGLLRADFLTPAYDITFSSQADACKRRRKRDVYDDLNMLEKGDNESIVFFGGKDYLPLFCRLTGSYLGTRTALFNSSSEPKVQGVQFVRHQTRTRTNWHYEAVHAHLDGELSSLLGSA